MAFIPFGLIVLLANLFVAPRVEVIPFIGSVVLISVGVAIIIFGKSTYKVQYNEEKKTIILKAGKSVIEFERDNILNLKEITYFVQYPVKALSYTDYELVVKLEGKTKRFRFVVYDNQDELIRNLEELKAFVKLHRYNTLQKIIKEKK